MEIHAEDAKGRRETEFAVGRSQQKCGTEGRQRAPTVATPSRGVDPQGPETPGLPKAWCPRPPGLGELRPASS